MDEQTKLRLAQAYAKAIRTSLYGRKPELSDQHYKELKDCNANSVFDRDEALYIERSKLWNDADQTRTLCRLVDEAEKIISSNLPVSEPLPSKVKFQLQQIALADDEMVKNKHAAETYRDMVRKILDECYGNVR